MGLLRMATHIVDAISSIRSSQNHLKMCTMSVALCRKTRRDEDELAAGAASSGSVENGWV